MIFDIDAAEKVLEELRLEKEALDICRDSAGETLNALSAANNREYDDIVFELTESVSLLNEKIDSFRLMIAALDTIKAIYIRTEASLAAKTDPLSRKQAEKVALIRLTDLVPGDLLNLFRRP